VRSTLLLQVSSVRGRRNSGDAENADWKRRDWKTRDLKSMESVTIFKSKSYRAEIKTVYGGMVAMLKARHQGMAASAVALRDEITLLIASE